MMKTPGIDLGVPARIGAVGMLYRIVSGETAALLKGELIQLKLPDLIPERVILNLKGHEITVEGLPKSLEGKSVTFKVTGNSSTPLLEILIPNKKESVPQGKSNEVKSGASPSSTIAKNEAMTETKGAPVSAHTAATKKAIIRHATLISSIESIPRHKSSFGVMVTHTSGKKALLTPIPFAVPTAKESPKTTTAKTAHAVAHTKHPERLIQQEKPTSPIEINLNKLAAPLRKGEQLLVEVKHSKTNKPAELILKPVNLSTAQATTAKQTGRTAELSFPIDRVITTRVEQRLPSGKITFQWQGQKLEAPAPPNVKAGDILVLKSTANPSATSKLKTPMLEVVDLVSNLPEKATNLFKQRIAMSEPLSQVLRNLTQPVAPATVGDKPLPPAVTTQLGALTTLLENYTVTDTRPLDGIRLENMIRHSGQLYEALLGKEVANGEKPEVAALKHDLKAILLKLVEVTQTAERSTTISRITQAGDQGAARIESQQSINLLAFQQAEPVRIEFPLIVQGAMSTVQMAISMETGAEQETAHDHDEASGEAFNILFALELSQLGKVRVDARITHRSVHATIYSEKSQARNLFQQHISRLTERLEGLGFKEIQLSAGANSALAEVKKEHFSRLELGLPISKGLLDVTG